MIKLETNPIDGVYSTSPTPHFAAVHLEDVSFRMITDRKSGVKSDKVAKFRDGGFGRIFQFEIPGRKTPLTVINRWHKADENDFKARNMFYVKHEDVPEMAEEMTLVTGLKETEEVEF